MDLLTNFKAARRAATPLIAINCFDPEATMQSVQKLLNGKADTTPIIQWDIIRGMMHRNDAGKIALAETLKSADATDADELTNPVEALVFATKLPEDTVLFIQNAQSHLKPDKCKADYVQAVWNLRDAFKYNSRTLVLLGAQIQLPVELQQDVLILDEKLPDDEKLRAIIDELVTVNEITAKIDTDAAVDALRGLAAFPAEQAVAMGLSKTGLDVQQLWDRKRQLINDTPGLSVWKGGQKFDDLGGLEEIKSRYSRIINGKKPPRVIVWLDEIEKAMSGSDAGGGDTSGTSQDQLGVLLSEMQDKEYSGGMLVGVPGAAKSAFAKAVANEAGILTIKLDLGEMKGQFVGLSEERIRQAMKIIEAVGGIGGAFFIATSNDIRAVRPELKRRFKRGIYFFDLPLATEKRKIWDIYLKRYELKFDKEFKQGVTDAEWTGAEIESCCQVAWEENIPLSEAARGIIPVAVSARNEVDRLRAEADGRYSSVNHPGAYVRNGELSAVADEEKKATRRLKL